MATHSSILAWRIPWIEEPGRLQSMGSQSVRHDGTHPCTPHSEGRGHEAMQRADRQQRGKKPTV